MTKTSNQKARNLVQDRKPFKGSHTFAEWQGTVYAVYSYGRHFPLFAFDSIEKRWYENGDRYSPTTSRHKVQLHPHAEMTKVNTAELQGIARG